jgi:uncharacterized protein YjdB
MSKSGRTLKAAILVALSSWSCSSTAPEPTPQVAAIVVSPASSTLAPDAQLPLQAQVRDGSGAIMTDAAITWTVQDPAIVSVSEAGVVKALAPGTSQVAANALGKFGIAVVTVSPAATQGTDNPGGTDPGSGGSDPGSDSPSGGSPVQVASVTVATPSKSLAVGSTLQLTATAIDARGNAVPHQSFVWSSSNTDKATVSSSGVVAGKKQGGVTITAQLSSTGGKSGSVDLDVKRK